jgi:cytochrome c553
MGVVLLTAVLACQTPLEPPDLPEEEAPIEAKLRTGVPSEPEWVYDPENAQDILDTCAGCHGKDGEGGGDGTYPRLAGMKAKYIARQLRAFKKRERINIPMYPYAIERDLPETDVLDVSRLLSKMKLLTEMPEFDDSMSAFQKLSLARKVFNIPRAYGDVERGAELYEEKCRSCHGREGKGRGNAPMLAGQYSDYLERQIDLYRKGERYFEDDRMQVAIDSLDGDDIDDLLAYFSTRDD